MRKKSFFSATLLLFMLGCQPIGGSFFVSGEPVQLRDNRGNLVELNGSTDVTVQINQRGEFVTLETTLGRSKHQFKFENAFNPSPADESLYFVSSSLNGQPYDLVWSSEEIVVVDRVARSTWDCLRETRRTCGYEYNYESGREEYRCRETEIFGRQSGEIHYKSESMIVAGALLVPNSDQEVASFNLAKPLRKFSQRLAETECR